MTLHRAIPRWTLTLAMVFAGCTEPPVSTDYIRLEGAAPRLEAAPAARALLVVFWATWCPPCREETPWLLALARNPPAGLNVVVVSQDAERAAVEAFFDGPPDSSLHLRLDPERRLFDAFRVNALPATFLVVDGQLRARFDGVRQWNRQEIRDLLQRLLAAEKTLLDCPRLGLYA